MTPDPSERDGPLVEFVGVSKHFSVSGEELRVVEDFSCRLEAGEFLAVVGPSGCGKSTILMMLAGLTSPSQGEVRLRGKALEGPQTELGLAFQGAELLPWRTALSNVLLQAEVRHQSDAEAERRARDLLAQVGLAGFEDRYPGELSGGMSQRVALCRALLHDPPILLMDEPFGALDALTRYQMQLDLQTLCMENGKTVVLVTHSIDEAVFLADRVLVMSPRPTRVAADIRVNFPRPRSAELHSDPHFTQIGREITDVFTRLGVLKGAQA